MAVAYSTSAGAGDSSTSSNTQDSGNVVVPAGGLVLAFLGTSDGSPAAHSGATLDPTGTPQVFTQIGSTQSLGPYGGFSAWVRHNAAAVTAAVRGTFAAAQGERICQAYVVTGAGTSGAIGTPVFNSGTGTAVTTGPITTAVGDYVVACAYRLDTLASIDSFDSPSHTERLETPTVPSPYDRQAIQDTVATGTTTTLTWTLSGAPTEGWVTVAFVISATGGGGGGAPTISGVTPSTFRPGDTVVVSGTNFGATQGASTLNIDGSPIAAASWSDSLITFVAQRAALQYGSHNLTVTTSSTTSPSAVTLAPPVGWASYDIGTPASSGLLPFSPVLASGDQMSLQTVGGLVAGATDGTFSVSGSGYTPFAYEAWSSGSGWGAVNVYVVTAVSQTNTGDGSKSAPPGLTGWATALRRRRGSALSLLRRQDMPGATAAAGWQAFGDFVFVQSTATAAALAATVTAPAALTAALTTAIPLQASVAAQASVTGVLTGVAAALAANVAVQPAVTAALTTGIPLAASLAAPAAVTAALATAIPLASTIGAVASVSAQLGSPAAALAASVAAPVAVSAALTTGIPLACSVVAQSSVSAALGAPAAALAVTITGQSSVAAALSTAIPLAALVQAPASVSAALTAPTGGLAATVAAGASVTAALSTSIPLQAAIAASSSVAAALGTPAALVATVAQRADVTASLTTAIALSTQVAVGSATTAQLLTGIALAAQSVAQIKLTAYLGVPAPLAANIVARASVTAILAVAEAKAKTPQMFVPDDGPPMHAPVDGTDEGNTMAVIGRKELTLADVDAFAVSFKRWLARRPGNTIATFDATPDTGVSVVSKSNTDDSATAVLRGDVAGTVKVKYTVTTTPDALRKTAVFTVKVKAE